jgi:hypothetical protein
VTPAVADTTASVATTAETILNVRFMFPPLL